MSRGLLTAVAVAAFSIGANAQCQQIAGNYYCAQVDAIAYNNVGFAGTYNQITNMDSSSCQCSSQPVSFSGPLAPLNEEVFVSLMRFLRVLNSIRRSPSTGEARCNLAKSRSTTKQAPPRRSGTQNPSSTTIYPTSVVTNAICTVTNAATPSPSPRPHTQPQPEPTTLPPRPQALIGCEHPTTTPHQGKQITLSSSTIWVEQTDLVPGIHVLATPFPTPAATVSMALVPPRSSAIA